MEFLIGKHYKIIVNVLNKELTFDAKIIEDDGIFVTFTDRYNKKYTYNKNAIISVTEDFQ